MRQRTETLAMPLSPEDQQVQSMPDVSPTKWHRAHTAWFFEQFVVTNPEFSGLSVYDPKHSVEHFAYLFNSYYQQVGSFYPRPKRGLISRPSSSDITSYRAVVDAAVEDLIDSVSTKSEDLLCQLIVLGLHHEQQHQELLLMDAQHVLSQNPFSPAYLEGIPEAKAGSEPLTYSDFEGGVFEFGTDAEADTFCFDNEGPRHKAVLRNYKLANRLVTNAEWLEFVLAGGYSTPSLWLSDGWAWVQSNQIDSPLYWRLQDQSASIFGLYGEHPANPGAAVCNVSYYEADAFARFAGARLPTELEWEHATTMVEVPGDELESTSTSGSNLGFKALRPTSAKTSTHLTQMFGDCWEWTSSPYIGHPGYRPPTGAIGEYNGKFMSNQMVLRGGSFATATGHIRSTYRNFFPPSARWPFTGLRLAI